jgi:hypothetical protein
VLIDAYSTPFMYMFCSDQTCMQELVKGICLLLGVIWHSGGKHVIVMENLCDSKVFTFPLIPSLEINECLCYCSSSDRIYGRVCSR